MLYTSTTTAAGEDSIKKIVNQYDDACGSKRDMKIFEDSIKSKTMEGLDPTKPVMWPDSSFNPPQLDSLKYKCLDITDKL
jgi:hypothetical protein